MYSIEIFNEGICALCITELSIISEIHDAREKNLRDIERRERMNVFKNRFSIPLRKTKKEYQEMWDETAQKIRELIKEMQPLSPENKIFIDIEREQYSIKKSKLNKILKLYKKFDEGNLLKAKTYPIEQLIEFNSAGFAKCLWHSESHGSMKWYKDRNKVHCFGCHIDADSIDIYMKLYTVDFNEAIKRLS